MKKIFIWERFWIPKARTRIKSFLRKCVTCLKVQGKPYWSPLTPSFSIDRISIINPLQITGVDYTGAISVRDGGHIHKYYLVLFTCAVTRAVHWETAEDSTEVEILRAMTRFVYRRSFPSIIYSDNAKYFIAASKTLHNISYHVSVQNHLASRGIQWKICGTGVCGRNWSQSWSHQWRKLLVNHWYHAKNCKR